jgi:hypothetical protein
LKGRDPSLHQIRLKITNGPFKERGDRNIGD